MALREQGHSLVDIAEMAGDPKLTATLSAILREVDSVGRDAERRVRAGLGLPSRDESPAERERKELLRRLNKHEVSLTMALRMALELLEGSLYTNEVPPTPEGESPMGWREWWDG